MGKSMQMDLNVVTRIFWLLRPIPIALEKHVQSKLDYLEKHSILERVPNDISECMLLKTLLLENVAIMQFAFTEILKFHK